MLNRKRSAGLVELTCLTGISMAGREEISPSPVADGGILEVIIFHTFQWGLLYYQQRPESGSVEFRNSSRSNQITSTEGV